MAPGVITVQCKKFMARLLHSTGYMKSVTNTHTTLLSLCQINMLLYEITVYLFRFLLQTTNN